MLFIEAVQYILQKEGNQAKITKDDLYTKDMIIFSSKHPSDKECSTLFTYLQIQNSIPLPLNINSGILNTRWEKVS